MSLKRKESESRSTSDHLTKKTTVQRDSDELSEQSQSGKSDAKESYENNIEGCGQGSVDGDEENESGEEEEENNQEEEGEESEKRDDNTSPMRHELISKSQHDPIKTISIDRFLIAILIDDPTELTSDLVLKCQLGKPFDEFRKTIKNENIDVLFKKSCFGHFLELPKEHTARFQMSIVYVLLKRRIKYVGNDKDSKEGGKRWIKSGSTTMACRFVLA
ncbi:hypothetical protein FXO38_18708 [Capsicum annuum]|nr:hypothetical protein FXO37_21050 [Capsicum annuum]KAF3647328.1 hypothetical protein FXO38_18708 [Capsicum annuum]